MVKKTIGSPEKTQYGKEMEGASSPCHPPSGPGFDPGPTLGQVQTPGGFGRTVLNGPGPVLRSVPGPVWRLQKEVIGLICPNWLKSPNHALIV